MNINKWTIDSGRQRIKELLAILLSLLVVSGCDDRTNSQPESITILVAASAAAAVSEVAREFEQTSGTHVRISSGPSNGLAQKIISGAPADIFISASRKWTELIADGGMSVSSADLFANQMVLIVPCDSQSIQNLDDLLADSTKRIAIAGEQVPAGVYAEAILRDAGCYQQLSEAHQIVRGSDARVTTAFVELGEADAGVVYKTDAMQSSDARIVATFNNTGGEAVTYTVALLKSDADDDANAQSLMEKLRTSTAIWEEHGFQSLTK